MGYARPSQRQPRHDRVLVLEMVRVTEAAAISASKWVRTRRQ